MGGGRKRGSSLNSQAAPPTLLSVWPGHCLPWGPDPPRPGRGQLGSCKVSVTPRGTGDGGNNHGGDLWPGTQVPGLALRRLWQLPARGKKCRPAHLCPPLRCPSHVPPRVYVQPHFFTPPRIAPGQGERGEPEDKEEEGCPPEARLASLWLPLPPPHPHPTALTSPLESPSSVRATRANSKKNKTDQSHPAPH